jgi:hypothetical protein
MNSKPRPIVASPMTARITTTLLARGSRTSGHRQRVGADAPAAGRPQTADPAGGQGGFRLGPKPGSRAAKDGTPEEWNAPSSAAILSWRASIGSSSGWGAPRGFHALANPFALPDRCCAAWRFPSGFGAIADFLSLVFSQRQVEREQLLLHKQRTMPADDFRNRRLLPHKPILSAFISGLRPDVIIPRKALTPFGVSHRDGRTGK